MPGMKDSMQEIRYRKWRLFYRDEASGRRIAVWMAVIAVGLLLIGNAVSAGVAGQDIGAASRAER